MFAENRKISLRQVRRLLILDIFGWSSLMIPGMLSSMTGADGIFCLLFGMAGGMILLWLMKKNLQYTQKNYYDYMKDMVGQIPGDLFMVFYFLYFVTLCGFVLYQTTVLVLTWLLPEGSYVWVSFLLLALAAYGTLRGIEGRARIYEILFWFLGIPLLVMLFLALQEVRTDYWTPIVSSGKTELIQGSISFLIFLLPLTAILFLKPFCRKSEKLADCGKWALILVTFMDLIIYLILLGVFGKNTLGVLRRPVITLMGMVNLPGGFFTRQDVVMTGVWFFALFALLHTGIFQSTLILKEMFQEAGNRYSMCISLFLAGMAGIGFFHNTFLLEVYEIYQTWIVLPGMIGILVILLLAHQIKARGRNRKGEDASCGKNIS
ncbi:MAG: GerAB/ArcD/ProY family transporter [Lachnospiraceae bacterium]|nr:GerAB/ArcD/ProY family transporter [Lachnospiraceae bacterium]